MPKDEVGYIFIRDPHPDPRTVKENLARQPGVYFVAEFVGTFLVFAAVEFDTFQELQEAIAGIYWQAGLRSETSTIVKSSALAAPKRGSPEYCGLIRATIADRDPVEVLEDLDRTFEERFNADPNHEHFWYGAALVTGAYDLLIDLGADTKGEINEMVARDVRGVPGIRRTMTALAHLPGNELRPGKPAS
jgi:hypothetical protein